MAVALLVVEPGTMLVVFAVAVSAMFVPGAVPAFTCKTRVKLAVAFRARLLVSVQVMLPVPPMAGVTHDHPAGKAIDWKFMFGGVLCVNVGGVLVAAGPSLVTLCVYVTLLPAATELGAATLITTRSDCPAVATTSAAVALLFAKLGSVVEELTVTVSLIAVPGRVPAVTFTPTVNVPAPGAKLGSVQVIAPAEPTAGVTHDHPAGKTIDWNVVFGGVVSVRLALVATLGPPLVTTCV